jgi:hypothetical protein
MAHVKKHKDLQEHIENVYNFKSEFKAICSQYYDDDTIVEQPSVLPPVERIIVLGDVHGDWNKLIGALKLGKVIDDNNNWNGGTTVVVQVGDQIDRCRYVKGGPTCDMKEATPNDEPHDWRILQYFTKLHKQAIKKGGAVYSLMGNHELMNVQGDMRYASYQGFKEFENYKKPDGTIIKDGEEARRWAFKPGNPVSEFLACTRQVALIIGKNLFVHAGIIPKLAKKYSVQNINQLMSLYLLDKLKTKTKYGDLFNQSKETPLWTRTLGNIGLKQYSAENISDTDKQKTNAVCNANLDVVKKVYNIDKIYIGHTPLLSHGMGNICNGDVWMTDYGQSKAFGQFKNNDSIQVLQILNDNEVTVLKSE